LRGLREGGGGRVEGVPPACGGLGDGGELGRIKAGDGALECTAGIPRAGVSDRCVDALDRDLPGGTRPELVGGMVRAIVPDCAAPADTLLAGAARARDESVATAVSGSALVGGTRAGA
jgi:hypothetical protein